MNGGTPVVENHNRRLGEEFDALRKAQANNQKIAPRVLKQLLERYDALIATDINVNSVTPFRDGVSEFELGKISIHQNVLFTTD